MTNHRKTKEIRNHRRLAIISDFSLLAPPAGLEPKRELRAAAGVSRSKLPLREDLHLCLALRAHRSLQLRLQRNKKGNEKGTRRFEVNPKV